MDKLIKSKYDIGDSAWMCGYDKDGNRMPVRVFVVNLEVKAYKEHTDVLYHVMMTPEDGSHLREERIQDGVRILFAADVYERELHRTRGEAMKDIYDNDLAN